MDRATAQSILGACVAIRDGGAELTLAEQALRKEALDWLQANPRPATPREFGFGDEDRVFGRGE